MPKQSIPIELGGKTKHLRYTFNALVALEEKLGCSLSDIGTLLTGSVSVTKLRTLIWAGLIHDDKELTEEQVGEWLDLTSISEIAEKFAEALEAAFPDSGEEKNGASLGTKEKK